MPIKRTTTYSVRLVPHQPTWHSRFVRERNRIIREFGTKVERVEHVGSTAIPSIIAKPTIDMLMIVHPPRERRSIARGFARLGYSLRPTRPGRKWHVQYLKGPSSQRTFSIHVETTTSKRWRNDLRFRDYLRSHKHEAQQYAILKRRLAGSHPHDISSYTKGKASFIEDIIQRAKRSH